MESVLLLCHFPHTLTCETHFLRKFARNSKHNKTLSKAVYSTAHRRIRLRIKAHTRTLKNSTFALFYRMSRRSGNGITLNSDWKLLEISFSQEHHPLAILNILNLYSLILACQRHLTSIFVLYSRLFECV